MFFLAHHSYPKSNELGANCWGRNPPYELNVHKSWKTVNPAIQAMTSYGRDELWRIYASNGKLRHGELRTQSTLTNLQRNRVIIMPTSCEPCDIKYGPNRSWAEPTSTSNNQRPMTTIHNLP
ncbi:unnamed protein product [Microthlaspi erraticum]|uniref:Uncharacterized protein n=1 Tax=Microthlaspi erraticum TaxID=1685480 RepID=A0A6D2JVD5_9BRAS|nr:unnamed protein product [Microthlaspi erraticum]